MEAYIYIEVRRRKRALVVLCTQSTQPCKWLDLARNAQRIFHGPRPGMSLILVLTSTRWVNIAPKAEHVSRAGDRERPGLPVPRSPGGAGRVYVAFLELVVWIDNVTSLYKN